MPVLNDHDLELIERDSALPGLRCVLDPARLLQEIDDAPGQQVDITRIEDFRLEHVRYKPGVNCLGRYAFTLDGEPHLVYVKVFGPDGDRKLSKSVEPADAPGPFGPGRLVLPGAGLLISFFPNDAKLPHIARLSDKADRERLLGRIFKQDDGWRHAHYSILNYKPERRLVCRFEKPDGQCSTVKFYTPRGFARTLHFRRRVGFGEDLAIPRRLGESRKYGVHAFEWMPGSLLREWSLDPGSDIAMFRKTGELLARLHAGNAAGLQSNTGFDLAAYLEALAKQLRFILPEMSNEVDELLKTLTRIAQQAGGEDCPVHADFYDKQLIVGAQGMSMIDLDQARIGVAAEDLGCFIAHLEWLAIKDEHLDADRVALLAQTMLGGYQAGSGLYDKSAVAAWTALYLFQLSHHPFRDRASNWPGQTRKILHRVRSLLAEAGPGAD